MFSHLMNTFLVRVGKAALVLPASCCSFSEQNLPLQATQLSRRTSFPLKLQKLFTLPQTTCDWVCFGGWLLYTALRPGFQGQTAYHTLDLSPHQPVFISQDFTVTFPWPSLFVTVSRKRTNKGRSGLSRIAFKVLWPNKVRRSLKMITYWHYRDGPGAGSWQS